MEYFLLAQDCCSLSSPLFGWWRIFVVLEEAGIIIAASSHPPSGSPEFEISADLAFFA